MFYIRYALKSVIQRKRQYISIFSVCIISVSVILSLLFICNGMLKALRIKAIQYYGGEVQVLCTNRNEFESPDELINNVVYSFNKLGYDVLCNHRFDYEGRNVELFFNGSNTVTRIVKGINFSEEKDLLEKITFVDSKFDDNYANCILISAPVADKLGCVAGDSLTFLVKTVDGQINTSELRIAGIFQDSSLFGMYTLYVDNSALQTITGYPEGYFNRIGIYIKNKELKRADIYKINNLLSELYSMDPVPKNKDSYIGESYYHYEPYYGLITLDANRPEVVMMSNALQLIVYFIIIPLVLIVAIGIACSYRVVILKRIVETSTFRALGLKSGGVMKLFFTEVLLILLVGFIGGVIISFVATTVLGHFNFSFIPAFDLFLIGGKIKADYSLGKMVIVLLVISFSTLTGVFVTLRNIIHLSPAKAFATTV